MLLHPEMDTNRRVLQLRVDSKLDKIMKEKRKLEIVEENKKKKEATTGAAGGAGGAGGADKASTGKK